MPTYKGKYSQDYQGDLGGDLNYMPGISLVPTPKTLRPSFPVESRLLMTRAAISQGQCARETKTTYQ